MTDEQAVMLAAIEQKHRVSRIPDDSPVGEQLLSNCVTGTRVYVCGGCHAAFAIEPDGECTLWAFEPLVD